MPFCGSRTTWSWRAATFVALAAGGCSVAAAAAASWLVSSSLTLGADPSAALITSVAVDLQGDSVVAGLIGSYRFPGLDSTQVTNAGQGARFVARYDAVTGAQQFVALVGNARDDAGRLAMTGLALDANGNAYVPAFASSLDFPVSGGTYVAAGAPALYRVSALGQVTRLPAALDPALRSIRAIALDTAGNLYITGSAGAGLATTAGAPYGTAAVAAGCIAPFALKLDRTGQTLLYATYLGFAGTQGERCGGNVTGGPFDPTGYALTVDAAGNAYVTGQAEPGVRATPGALDWAPKTGTLVGGGQSVASHAFVTKINPAGTALVYSVRVGGSGHDRGTAILTDGAGNAYVAGKTTTSTFPQPGTTWPQVSVFYECLLNTPELGFMAKLSSDGAALQWSGLLPGAGNELDECALSGPEAPLSIAADASGNVFATGYSQPSNRGTRVSRNAIQPVDGDGFLAQVDAAGQLLYLTWLSGGTDALAVDANQDLHIAGWAQLQRLSAGSLPVEVSLRGTVACASVPAVIDVHVAGAGESGTVDVLVDGTRIGTSPVHASLATLSGVLANGVHRIGAVYRGAGPFDGYSANAIYVAVDQAGTCS